MSVDFDLENMPLCPKPPGLYPDFDLTAFLEQDLKRRQRRIRYLNDKFKEEASHASPFLRMSIEYVHREREKYKKRAFEAEMENARLKEELAILKGLKEEYYVPPPPVLPPPLKIESEEPSPKKRIKPTHQHEQQFDTSDPSSHDM